LEEMIVELAERRVEEIFHASGATRVGKYELALTVCETLGLDSSLVMPATLE